MNTMKKERKPRARTMHASGMPADVLKNLKSGEQRTLTEWAEKYDVPYNTMSACFVSLRKRGYHYHPYSGAIRVGLSQKTGIMVDIMEKESYLVDGLSKYEDNLSLPHLRAMLKKLETGVMQFPQLGPQIQAFADRITLATIESRRRTRKLELENK